MLSLLLTTFLDSSVLDSTFFFLVLPRLPRGPLTPINIEATHRSSTLLWVHTPRLFTSLICSNLSSRPTNQVGHARNNCQLSLSLKSGLPAPLKSSPHPFKLFHHRSSPQRRPLVLASFHSFSPLACLHNPHPLITMNFCPRRAPRFQVPEANRSSISTVFPPMSRPA